MQRQAFCSLSAQLSRPFIVIRSSTTSIPGVYYDTLTYARPRQLSDWLFATMDELETSGRAANQQQMMDLAAGSWGALGYDSSHNTLESSLEALVTGKALPDRAINGRIALPHGRRNGPQHQLKDPIRNHSLDIRCGLTWVHCAHNWQLLKANLSRHRQMTSQSPLRARSDYHPQVKARRKPISELNKADHHRAEPHTRLQAKENFLARTQARGTTD